MKTTFEHRPSLDGMRAVAALLVILFHAGAPLFGHGYTGVDVFFVLSGFLITSLLARELLDTGRLRFVAFYARRVRRLLPAALFVLLATAVAYEFFETPAAVSENRGGFVASALYVANWYFLGQSQDYFAEDAHPSPVQHYWSLSAEEQFYLVWPAVVLGLVFLGRRFGISIWLMAATLAVVGATYAGVIAIHDPMTSYFGTPARAYQLMLGATVALIILRRERARGERHRRSAGPVAGGAALAGAGLILVLLAGSPLLGTSSAYWHGICAALGTGVLLLALELAPLSRVGRWLSSTPARIVGRWSYAAYLWHWPVIIVGDDAGVLPDSWFPRTVLVVGATLALSGATFRLIERPTRRITLRTVPRQRLVATLGVGVAVAAGLIFPAVLRIDAAAEAVLSRAKTDAGRLVVVRKSAAKASTILLVGDSHAHYLYPAFARLAAAQRWTLVPAVENACPWPRVEATANDEVLPCEDMRGEALAAARKYHPDIAILVSRSIVVRPLEIAGRLVNPSEPGWLDEVKKGTSAFLGDLRPLVGSMLIVEPLPETTEPMVDCLAAGEDPADCAAPAINRSGTLPLESYWRTVPGVTTVSLDELICPDGTCPAMVDGIPTHRDTNHLTPDFSRHLAPALDRYLRSRAIILRTGEVRVG